MTNGCKRVLTRILTALMVLTMLFGAISASAEETPKIKIGIIQLVQHVALDASCQGFIDALKDNGYTDGENIIIDFQNGQGDQSNLSTIADRFVSNGEDLILAIATPAALAVAGKTTDIPILATAITDFVEARLVESNELPGTNVSGTTDMASIDTQIGLVQAFVPDAKSVGVLYNSGEVNSVVQAQAAKAAIESRGLTYVEVTVTSSNEVQQAAESIMKQVDAVYLPTDNVMASSMPIIYGVSIDAKKPVICGESGMVTQGGLATIGINYYNLGYQTGLMAVRLLQDPTLKISEMPVESQTEYDYSVNKTVADDIGIAIPEELVQYAFDME
ncbi:ABC transporter substrate-binding protein [Clostridia bacterium]|nr:ABC transporter substrate-binding protein [Clostridia bacterium]